MSGVVFITEIPRLVDESPAKGRVVVETVCALVTTRSMGHSRVDTGLMRSEWKFDVHETELEGIVFNLIRYAVYNEYGTRYMSAHPMLRPAITESRAEFELLMSDIYSL